MVLIGSELIQKFKGIEKLNSMNPRRQDDIPHITYIVSCINRPDHLACCLYSLKIQSDPLLEVIVVDNSLDQGMEKIVKMVDDKRFRYYNPQAPNCYHSSNYGAKLANGQFLCFPSDDSYYVPLFGQIMYQFANITRTNLVYCDMLYDPRIPKRYAVVEVTPTLRHIDKTGFIIRKDYFTEFPLDNAVVADGIMIENLVKKGIKHGKASGVLVVHN